MQRSRMALFALVALVPLVSGGCGLGTATNEHERTVLIDYHYDQFSAVFAAYFPNEVSVRQGDTLVFKQAWSGEPHTVTFLDGLDAAMKVVWPYLKDAPPFPAGPPPDPTIQEAVKFLMQLPSTQSQTGIDFAQAVSQPCYIESGAVPSDPDKPCPRRSQPSFNGHQTVFNSGVLPYEGQDGNVFRMPIASDAAIGTHYYYCAVHGLLMSGAVTVVPASASIPPQSAVNTAAQKRVSKYTDIFSRALADARGGKAAVKGNLAGIDLPPITGTSAVTEFVPKTITIKRGQKVTWNLAGDAHTVSFDVPVYGPEIKIGKDGSVHYAPETINPEGGPGFPQDTSGGSSSGGAPGTASPSPGGGQTSPSAPPSPSASASPGAASAGGQGGGAGSGPPPPSPPVVVDAGNYDGSKFLSSGLGGANNPGDIVSYSVTFTRAGTYKFACLVHPLMVGEVDVK